MSAPPPEIAKTLIAVLQSNSAVLHALEALKLLALADLAQELEDKDDFLANQKSALSEIKDAFERIKQSNDIIAGMARED